MSMVSGLTSASARIGTFLFKVRDPSGRLHRIRSSDTSLRDLRSHVREKMGDHGHGREVWLTFEDDDGDEVALTTDDALCMAVEMAQEQGQDRVLIRASFPPTGSSETAVATGAPVAAPTTPTAAGGNGSTTGGHSLAPSPQTSSAAGDPAAGHMMTPEKLSGGASAVSGEGFPSTPASVSSRPPSAAVTSAAEEGGEGNNNNNQQAVRRSLSGRGADDGGAHDVSKFGFVGDVLRVVGGGGDGAEVSALAVGAGVVAAAVFVGFVAMLRRDRY